MAEIQGDVPERSTRVADALARSIDDGRDVGGSVAIVVVVTVWSTTKTMPAPSSSTTSTGE